MANSIIKTSAMNGVHFWEENPNTYAMPNILNKAESAFPKPGWDIELCVNQFKFRETTVRIQFYSDYDSHTVEVRRSDTDALIASITPSEVHDASASLGYKFYEFPITGKNSPHDVIDVPWYVKIRGSSSGGSNSNWLFSEPQIWKWGANVMNDARVLIAWKNSTNLPDFYWTGRPAKYMVLYAQAYKRKPYTEREVYRDANDQVKLLALTRERRLTFEFFHLSAYQQEILSFALGCDEVYINSLEWVFQEGVEEPNYRTRFQLSNVMATGTLGSRVLELCCEDPADPVPADPIVWDNGGGDHIITGDSGTLVWQKT